MKQEGPQPSLCNAVGVIEAEQTACSKQALRAEKNQHLKRLRQAGDPATSRLQHAGALRPASSEQPDSPDVKANKRRVLCPKDQHRFDCRQYTSISHAWQKLSGPEVLVPVQHVPCY